MGRDVESMVRDLVETSVRIVKEEMMVKVKDKAEEQANQRLVEILVPSPQKQSGFKNPLEMLFGGNQNTNQTTETQDDMEIEKNVKISKNNLLLVCLKMKLYRLKLRSNSLPCLICFKEQVWNKWV